MKLANHHAPVPQYGTPEPITYGGVIEYKLTDAELEAVRAGRLDTIPTAADRGLVAPPPEPKVWKDPVPESRKGKVSVAHITEELLRRELKTKTQLEVAREQGVSTATISNYAIKYGITERKPKPQRKRANALISREKEKK